MDEQEFFDSEEGQKWMAELDRATKAAVAGFQKMASSLECIGYALQEMQDEIRAKTAGQGEASASADAVSKLLQRVRSS